MRSRSLTTEQVLTLLAETPLRLAALTAGLAPEELQTRPTPDEWSANEVLAHLRACADVWGNCIMAIIAADAPTLRAVNPTTWIKKTDYLELEFRPSLRSFTTQRADLLAVLEPLLIDEGCPHANSTSEIQLVAHPVGYETLSSLSANIPSKAVTRRSTSAGLLYP